MTHRRYTVDLRVPAAILPGHYVLLGGKISLSVVKGPLKKVTPPIDIFSRLIREPVVFNVHRLRSLGPMSYHSKTSYVFRSIHSGGVTSPERGRCRP